MKFRSIALLLVCLPSIAQTVRDPGLKVQTWLSGFGDPTGMAFLNQSGDALVIEKNSGRVKLMSNRSMGATVLDLPVSNDSERGLLGITLSPGFATDNLVYLYYTASASDGRAPISNSVKRYRWDGAQRSLTFDRKIIDLPATPGPNHDGGKMTFGPDGKLYIAGPELNRNEQTTNHAGTAINRTASILRLNSSGTSVTTNPFYDVANKGTSRAALNDIYAYGIRNSFGIGIDPVSGNLWESENGPSSFDEINRITPGFNGGWDAIMGPSSRNGGVPADLVPLGDRAHYEDPKFSWLTPVAPTDVFFMPSARLGGEYKNDLFVGALRGGKIYHYELSASRKTLVLSDGLTDLVADNDGGDRFAEQDSILFGDNFGTVTDLVAGPGGMYVVSLNGAIYRITTVTPPAAGRGVPLPEPSTACVLCLLLLCNARDRRVSACAFPR